MKTEAKKAILISIVAVGIVGGGLAGFFLSRNKLETNQNSNSDNSNSVIKKEEDIKKDPENNLNNQVEEDKMDDGKADEIPNNPSNDATVNDQNSNSGVISGNKKPVFSGNSSSNSTHVPNNPTKPVIPSVPEKPSDPSEGQKPEEIEKPEIPVVKPEPPEEKPTVPEEKPGEEENPDDNEQPKEENLLITNQMIQDNVFFVRNKEYKTVTLSSDISDYVKIIFEQVNIQDGLFLEESGNYQLNLVNCNVSSLKTVDSRPQFYSMRSMNLNWKNKSLEGATVNIDSKSVVESLTIHHNIEINGTNRISDITVQSGEEVVLNVPAQNVVLNSTGIVAVNQKIDKITNKGQGSTVIVNAPITTFLNQESSNIYINHQNTITTLNNTGENTVVSGNGTLINTYANANNMRIYTDVQNQPVLAENVDQILVRKETQNSIVRAVSTSQGSVTFTLAQAVDNLTIDDISVICNAGRTMTLYRLSTSDNKTFTLTTSYFKNDSYALYITLANGNIVSKDFETDYANPTVQDVVVKRVSDTKATLELYGVDEGGTLYYILEDAITREVISASSIQKEGKSTSVKVGYNSILVDNLEPSKSYRLYYVMEGFFENVSKVKGPFEISAQVEKDSSSDYKIVYAKEEVANRFVFQLNRVPEHELTLEDFVIKCPSEKNLTTSGADFMVSPDGLTYILIVPDNYGHKDNKYTVDIKISDTETIHGSFVSHFDPPVITGAVDNVVRVDEDTANFTFYSDEAGMVYYGVYDWNGGIYDYNSSTPFASDVITGSIRSKKQVLNAGSNTIVLDLSTVTVTKNTRVWALFVDEVGNYRVGFVDHYKIPDYVPDETPKPDTSLKITNFTATNKSLVLEFNEVIGWVSSDDIQLSVLEGGSLPSKLLFSIDNDTPKRLSIDILNYVLPTGVYELKLNVFDQEENIVTLVQRIEIK